MGLISSAISSLRRLEEYMGPEATKDMRFCAVLALFVTIIISIIPYICGQLLDWVVNAVTKHQPIYVSDILDVCTVIVLMVVIWYVASTHAKHKMVKLALATGRRIRDGMNTSLMKASIKELDHIPAGDLNSRFVSDASATCELISTDYTGFISQMAMIVVITAMMFVTSPMLAVLYVIIMPVMFFVSRTLTKESEEQFALQKKKVSEFNVKMSDIMSTHGTIKMENLEDRVMDQFNEANKDFTKAFVSTRTRSGMIAPVANIFSNIGYMLTVMFGAVMLYLNQLDVGMFLTFMIYIRLVKNPLSDAMSIYDGLRDRTISLDRVLEVLDIPAEEAPQEDDGFRIEKGAIEFDNVCFSYNEGEEILHSVSFKVEPGKMTVLVGPTASGKTTVANLLMGFYRPDSGTIRIDGRDLSTISRSSISTDLCAVLQNPWVFEGTIRENIIYNRGGLSEEDLETISKVVGLDRYISMLPDGFDTRVGEEMNRLPLAQRRMLALCRALIGDPKIVVLDEAVAGLDPIIGQSIVERLKSLKKGHSIIVITHNRALIEQADEMIRLENGYII